MIIAFSLQCQSIQHYYIGGYKHRFTCLNSIYLLNIGNVGIIKYFREYLVFAILIPCKTYFHALQLPLCIMFIHIRSPSLPPLLFYHFYHLPQAKPGPIYSRCLGRPSILITRNFSPTVVWKEPLPLLSPAFHTSHTTPSTLLSSCTIYRLYSQNHFLFIHYIIQFIFIRIPSILSNSAFIITCYSKCIIEKHQ